VLLLCGVVERTDVGAMCRCGRGGLCLGRSGGLLRRHFGINLNGAIDGLVMLRTSSTRPRAIDRMWWWWEVCDRARARVQVGGGQFIGISRTCVIQMRSFSQPAQSALVHHPLQQPGALLADLVSFLCYLGLMPPVNWARCGCHGSARVQPLFPLALFILPTSISFCLDWTTDSVSECGRFLFCYNYVC
jgi:hypothetical protein